MTASSTRADDRTNGARPGAAELFRDNFKTYEAGVGADITAAGPHERAASIAI
jgi:xanthine/CO dehydrogenase XdhC/CoxF family maturation factor